MEEGAANRAGSSIRRHPKIGAFVASAVASAVVGLIISPDTFFAIKNSIFGGGKKAQSSVNALPSQIVSGTRIGLFNIEENGRVDAARVAFGEPTKTIREPGTCRLQWQTLGVEGEFYNLGGHDACTEGDFCDGLVWGRQWVTQRGLQVADTVTRLQDLYPEAREAHRPGAFEYWVLDRGSNLCGRDPLGGLVASTYNGRVSTLTVNFHAGGE